MKKWFALEEPEHASTCPICGTGNADRLGVSCETHEDRYYMREMYEDRYYMRWMCGECGAEWEQEYVLDDRVRVTAWPCNVHGLVAEAVNLGAQGPDDMDARERDIERRMQTLIDRRGLA